VTRRTTIGELSQATGVPVRTIRFYCDEGVLDFHRSSGGHRVFNADAVDALLLIRRLRALGLGLEIIGDIQAARISIDEAVRVEQAAVDAGLAVLAGRREALATVQSVIHDGPGVHHGLVEFWRQLFAGASPPEAFDGFVEMTVPPVPAQPNLACALAYAELVALARQPDFGVVMGRQLWRFDPSRISDRRGLVTGVAQACDLALPLVRSGRPPAAGPAVDRFVDAHAWSRREHDTPQFRRALIANGGADRDPRVRTYWERVTEITGEATTVGTLQRWLYDALRQTA
jgi:excisionase family DNA binding protein